jgi:hypothetical protein
VTRTSKISSLCLRIGQKLHCPGSICRTNSSRNSFRKKNQKSKTCQNKE